MKRWDKYNIVLPKERTEKQEFAPDKKGIIICPKCGCFYFGKRWHHPQNKSKIKNQKSNIKLCPACQMIKDNLFEGRLIIKGFGQLKQEIKTDLINLIKNFGEKAYLRDPLDRIIKINKEKGDLIITFTENQLCQKLSQKLKQTFKKMKIKISHSPEPSDTFYIQLTID